MEETVTYYTDASFRETIGIGAWAYFEDSEKRIHKSGVYFSTNSSHMELESVLKILEHTPHNKIHIFTDCQFVLEQFGLIEISNPPLFRDRIEKLSAGKEIGLTCLSSKGGKKKTKHQLGINKCHKLSRKTLLSFLDNLRVIEDCPFCYSKEGFSDHENKKVKCGDCASEGPRSQRFRIIEKWNIRKGSEDHECVFCGSEKLHKKYNGDLRCMVCIALRKSHTLRNTNG
jgi:hypothetical protein